MRRSGPGSRPPHAQPHQPSALRTGRPAAPAPSGRGRARRAARYAPHRGRPLAPPPLGRNTYSHMRTRAQTQIRTHAHMHHNARTHHRRLRLRRLKMRRVGLVVLSRGAEDKIRAARLKTPSQSPLPQLSPAQPPLIAAQELRANTRTHARTHERTRVRARAHTHPAARQGAAVAAAASRPPSASRCSLPAPGGGRDLPGPHMQTACAVPPIRVHRSESVDPSSSI